MITFIGIKREKLAEELVHRSEHRTRTRTEEFCTDKPIIILMFLTPLMCRL